MNKEKIAKIVSQVKSKQMTEKQSKENNPILNKDKITRLANIMLDIERCIRALED